MIGLPDLNQVLTGPYICTRQRPVQTPVHVKTRTPIGPKVRSPAATGRDCAPAQDQFRSHAPKASLGMHALGVDEVLTMDNRLGINRINQP